jgi:peroxiredoxin
MLVTANKYPSFDLSEIVTDNDLLYRAFQPLQPVKAGNIVPDFNLNNEYTLWQRFSHGAETHGPVSIRQLLNKPLVIAFYSRHWLNYGLQQLIQLDALQAEIKAHGGNLLIVAAEKDEQLNKTAWENSLSLNFYYDVANKIAEEFRVYSDNDPVWNKFSGVDTNVPLLATYVINSSRQVVYDHIDTDFTGAFPAKDILSAVYESALIHNNKKSA